MARKKVIKAWAVIIQGAYLGYQVLELKGSKYSGGMVFNSKEEAMDFLEQRWGEGLTGDSEVAEISIKILE